MASLWNSLTLEISNTCMFLTIAEDIWDAVYQTCSKALDIAQLFKINVKIGIAKPDSNKVCLSIENLNAKT